MCRALQAQAGKLHTVVADLQEQLEAAEAALEAHRAEVERRGDRVRAEVMCKAEFEKDLKSMQNKIDIGKHDKHKLEKAQAKNAAAQRDLEKVRTSLLCPVRRPLASARVEGPRRSLRTPHTTPQDDAAPGGAFATLSRGAPLKQQPVPEQHGVMQACRWLVKERDHLGVAGGEYDFAAQDMTAITAQYAQALQAKEECGKGVNKTVMSAWERADKQYRQLRDRKATVIHDRDTIRQVRHSAFPSCSYPSSCPSSPPSCILPTWRSCHPRLNGCAPRRNIVAQRWDAASHRNKTGPCKLVRLSCHSCVLQTASARCRVSSTWTRSG